MFGKIFQRNPRPKTVSEDGTPGTRPEPAEVFGGLSDEAWLATLENSLVEPVQRGLTLPGFPAETTQKQFVGSAGQQSLRDGFKFYTTVQEYARSLNQPVGSGTRILDFGCGWSRILRCFLKNVRSDGLYGADVDPNIIAFCHAASRYCRYSVVPAVPPSGFPAEFFDLVYAYSVFSHLGEEAQLKWVKELARILKPNGILLVTTQGRGFIDFCASLRSQETLETGWHRSLARSFVDRDQALKDYDEGRFLHSATGGGDFRPSSFYGETLIPKGYVERVWSSYLRLVEFRDDPQFLPQALIVMQK
jgi:SAM-dependent methyltransferase